MDNNIDSFSETDLDLDLDQIDLNSVNSTETKKSASPSPFAIFSPRPGYVNGVFQAPIPRRNNLLNILDKSPQVLRSLDVPLENAQERNNRLKEARRVNRYSLNKSPVKQIVDSLSPLPSDAGSNSTYSSPYSFDRNRDLSSNASTPLPRGFTSTNQLPKLTLNGMKASSSVPNVTLFGNSPVFSSAAPSPGAEALSPIKY
ncbi:MAG: hypothetical protein Q8R83_04010 [Legionellaceae bacterium]|nr:hypothetical protein [Legionellaceae bacterium]